MFAYCLLACLLFSAIDYSACVICVKNESERMQQQQQPERRRRERKKKKRKLNDLNKRTKNMHQRTYTRIMVGRLD